MCLDGQEYEYHQRVEFFSARTKKSFVSSAIWKMEGGELMKVGGNCLGYDEWKREIDEGIPRDKRTVSMRLLHAFNVIHLDWYHLVPVFDDNGKAVLYKGGDRKGEQVMEKVLCEGRRCEMCRDGVEKVFGKKGHWSVGSGHLGDLAGYITEIEKNCSYCGEGMLEVISWECSECGHPVIDMNETRLSDNEIAEIVLDIQECQKCGNKDYLLRQLECDKCQDPTPLSIFDVDIDVKRQGEGTNSTIQIPRFTACDISDELKDLCKPYDFKQVFAPDPLDIQARLLKINNKYGPDGGETSRDYGTDANYND